MSAENPSKNVETSGQGRYPPAQYAGSPQYYNQAPQQGYASPLPQSAYPQEGNYYQLSGEHYSQECAQPMQQQYQPQGGVYAPVSQQGYPGNNSDNNTGSSGVQNWQPPMQNPAMGTAVVGEPAYFDYKPPAKYDEVHEFKGSNEWATSMLKSPCSDCCFCTQAFFCPMCCAFMQRKKLLLGDWKRYICCAGLWNGCCPCFNSGCGSCGCCCMVTEVLCCLPCAVHGNRFMIMRHYNLKSDCCDVALMWIACIIQLVAMIIGSDSIRLLGDCVYLLVLACMLTQNEVQMKTYQYPNRAVMV